MSERTTGATDKTRVLALTDKQLARVMNGLVAAYSPADGEWHDDLAALAFTTCLDAIRGKPADAVVLTAAEAATVKEALHNAAIDAEEQAANELGNGCLQEADLWTEAAGTYRALEAKLGGGQ